jgi:hypothetical protein
MSTGTTAPWLARFRPERETLLWGALVVNFELLMLGSYAIVADPQLINLAAIRYWLYPLVWINVGAWAILRTTPTPTGTRQRRIGLAIAVGYFAVLSYFGGLFGPASPGPIGLDVSLLALPPGWGPAILYNGALLSVTLLPYKVVGYVALTYLVYATVLDAAGSAVTGVLGLLSCVSCSWPILATLVTGVAGSGTAVAGAVYAQSYGLSTVVFVVTVGLLYWRPFGR